MSMFGAALSAWSLASGLKVYSAVVPSSIIPLMAKMLKITFMNHTSCCDVLLLGFEFDVVEEQKEATFERSVDFQQLRCASLVVRITRCDELGCSAWGFRQSVSPKER